MSERSWDYTADRMAGTHYCELATQAQDPSSNLERLLLLGGANGVHAIVERRGWLDAEGLVDILAEVSSGWLPNSIWPWSEAEERDCGDDS